MQKKAQAQQNTLAEYEGHSYYYGRVTEDLKEHTKALVRVCEDAADRSMSIAKSHRQMAEQAKE